MEIDPLKAAEAIRKIYSALYEDYEDWNQDKNWSSGTLDLVRDAVLEVLPLPRDPTFDDVLEIGPIRGEGEWGTFLIWPNGSAKYGFKERPDGKEVTVIPETTGLGIQVTGYTDFSNSGIVAMVDMWSGNVHPRVVIWEDAAKEDSGYAISLERAQSRLQQGPDIRSRK